MTSRARTRNSPEHVAIPDYRALDRLCRQLGNAFYVYDEEVFVANYEALLAAFRRHYEPTSIAYSYKTNYMPPICARVHRLGGYAEIVSGMEYEMVRALGIADHRVIFNGPCKDIGTIEAVLVRGGIVNVDSSVDLAAVSAVARRHRRTRLNVGLRCNFSDPELPFSRFGLDVDGPEFQEAVAALRAQPNIRLGGLHCHYPNRDLATFRVRTESLLRVCDSLWQEAPDFLNLGGGFAGRMPPELASQFDYPVPSYREYADCVAGVIAARFGNGAGKRPQLFIEPGTGVVANCLSFVTRITSTKTVRDERIAACSGSVFNTAPTAKSIALPIRIVAQARRRGGPMPTHIVGYTCIESDYLARGLRADVMVGDFVVIDNVGSYSIVMKPPFILPNAPIVQLRDGGRSHRLIKRAERAADVFATFSGMPRNKARRRLRA
jgi:diaminopimelate decarboxylase